MFMNRIDLPDDQPKRTSRLTPTDEGLSATMNLKTRWPRSLGCILVPLLFLFLGHSVSAMLLESSSNGADAAFESNERGVSLLKEKKYSEAIDAFRSARRAKPLDVTIKKNLATAHLVYGIDLLDREKHGLAKSQFSASLEVDPEGTNARYHLAVSLHFLKETEQAAREFSRTVELDPKIAPAWEGLANCRYEEGKLLLAIEALEKAVTLQPDEKRLKDRLQKFRREQAVEGKFVGDHTSRFQIKFDADREDPRFINTILHELGEAYDKVGSDLGFRPEDRIPVILYSDKEFSHVTGSRGWVGGLYDGKIRLPTKNIANNPRRLRMVIVHEYTHAVVSRLCPNAPAWLQEGLAQFEEGKSVRDAKRTLRTALSRGGLVRLSKLPSASFASIKDPLVATRAYALSLVIVHELVERRSIRHLATYLETLRRVKDVDRAFDEVFGGTFQDFEEDIRSELGR